MRVGATQQWEVKWDGQSGVWVGEGSENQAEEQV